MARLSTANKRALSKLEGGSGKRGRRMDHRAKRALPGRGRGERVVTRISLFVKFGRVEAEGNQTKNRKKKRWGKGERWGEKREGGRWNGLREEKRGRSKGFARVRRMGEWENGEWRMENGEWRSYGCWRECLSAVCCWVLGAN
jgi:hypothetical protein